jgi:hypothetical protein
LKADDDLKQVSMALRAKLASIHSDWELPQAAPSRLGRPDMSFSPGLHLMLAGRAVGKTLTALALAMYQAADLSAKVLYKYVAEPGSMRDPEVIQSSFWTTVYETWLKDSEGGVLVIDSMTYLLTALETIRLMSNNGSISEVTYAGGLSPRDILGVLLHDAMARRANVAVIATVNSELFPVVNTFEGACEGQLVLSAPGVFSARDRGTRLTQEFTLDKKVVDQAAAILGYKAPGQTTLSQF